MTEIAHDDQVRIFISKRWNQITTVVPCGTNNKGAPVWRVTTWRPSGPLGHSTLAKAPLERELRYWEEDEDAGAILESWSNTPEWERGLKQRQFLSAWNACSRKGRGDLCRMLDRTKTLDEALELIPRVLDMLGNT